MEKVTRFSISLEKELLSKLDAFVTRSGYSNRSEAIRDFIRDRLVQEEWKDPKKEVVAVLILVYDHTARELSDCLNRIQHQHVETVISTTHIHLDHHNCLEVIILRGKAGKLKKITDSLLSTRNVKHGGVLSTTTGFDIP